jgi:hypothetical protein
MAEWALVAKGPKVEEGEAAVARESTVEVEVALVATASMGQALPHSCDEWMSDGRPKEAVPDDLRVEAVQLHPDGRLRRDAGL